MTVCVSCRDKAHDYREEQDLNVLGVPPAMVARCFGDEMGDHVCEARSRRVSDAELTHLIERRLKMSVPMMEIEEEVQELIAKGKYVPTSFGIDKGRRAKCACACNGNKEEFDWDRLSPIRRHRIYVGKAFGRARRR